MTTLIPRAVSEPTYEDLRRRTLLALSLVNQRVGRDGLDARDTEAVRDALGGKWDRPEEVG